ncbi:hypothetical protein CDL12_03583 [Handroanthus impetiginosus]|uniref:KIB1-4 beta-propeller domain-containing protein n=1 Tax=Handroanthus impetiginosus TaxID=429701 RepID=A0A2G9I251_9LAMI|nr:hypothetical protein CDL12_03583 [Handroanthus impetiginosus]
MYEIHTFYSISKNEYIKRKVFEFRDKQVAATSYGWLLLIDYSKDPLECFLVNTTSKERIELPSIEFDTDSCIYYKCVLSKPPTDPNCYVLLIPCWTDDLLFCRVGEKKFIKRSKQFGDDYFAASTNFKGKVYAWMSYSGNLVEVDFVGQNLLLNQMVNNKGQAYQIPVRSTSYRFDNQDYLVESCDELLLVHMIVYPHSGQPAYFKIFKIKVCERESEELRSIGDRTIFLSSLGCMSTLCAGNSGVKKNSIYYTMIHENRNVYVYDIKDRSKILIKPCDTKGTDMPPLRSWIML